MAESPQKGQGRNVSTREFGPRLCDYCNEAFRAFDDKMQTSSSYHDDDFQSSDYHPTLLSLSNAVRSGCQLCVMLEQQIREHGYYHLEGLCSDKDLNLDKNIKKVEWKQPILEILKHYGYHMEIVLWLDDGTRLVDLVGNDEDHFAYPGTSSRKEVSEELESMQKYRDLNYTPPSSTDSLPAWELCRSWIDNCIENHEACKGPHPGSDSQWWPTRLLYIGSLGDKDFGDDDLTTLNIQLHMTQDKPPIGPYMTLSHCWGISGEMLKLTVDTYEHRIKNGFSYGELPKTFQDAIRLCRFLRNEYIWIDSLCIIQDFNDDWIRESEMMAKVYQYSKCNIAATASQGPTEGCFNSRNPAVISLLKIRFQSLGDNLFLAYDLWDRHVEKAPLNKRAWVMQERAFAPRQIHCGREQLSWECHQTTACETFPFGFDFFKELRKGPELVALRLRSLGPRLSELNKLRLSETENDAFPNINLLYTDSYPEEEVTRSEWIARTKDRIYFDWTYIIEKYSSRALTHRTDKLAAIFGIASLIQDTLKDTDEYITGLWRSQFPLQLLWRSERDDQDDEPRDTVPSYDIGPSWSWTSLNTTVKWWYTGPGSGLDPRSLIDILDVRDGHTITGQATFDGTRESPLILRCLLYKIHVSKGEDPYILTSAQKHGDTESIALGGFKVALDATRMYMDSTESRHFWKQSYLIPVVSYPKLDTFSGLFVCPCQEKPGFYRRIAMFHYDLNREVLESTTDEDRMTVTLI